MNIDNIITSIKFKFKTDFVPRNAIYVDPNTNIVLTVFCSDKLKDENGVEIETDHEYMERCRLIEEARDDFYPVYANCEYHGHYHNNDIPLKVDHHDHIKGRGFVYNYDKHLFHSTNEINWKIKLIEKEEVMCRSWRMNVLENAHKFHANQVLNVLKVEGQIEDLRRQKLDYVDTQQKVA